VRRAYKIRLRPTAGQHLRLQAYLDGHRELYNAALRERRDVYERVVRRCVVYYTRDRPEMPVRPVRPAEADQGSRSGDGPAGAGSQEARLE
jgi:putative transposase